MLRIAVALFAIVLGFAPEAHAGPVVHVADGDCAALGDAVASAAPGEQTTIVLAHGGAYHSAAGADCGIYVHAGSVLVDAAGARIDTEVCAAYNVSVDPGAELTLRNALISSPDCGLANGIGPTVWNRGSLQIEASTLLVPSGVKDAPNASTTLRNVTIQSNIGFRTDGSLNVFSSTLLGTDVAADPGSHVAMANSVAPTPAGACFLRAAGASVQSLGGNVLGASCAWSVSSDRRSGDFAAGLGAPQDNGGLVPTAAPSSSSIVRGVGLAQYCEPVDARGLVRPAGACDAGAAQFDETKFVGEGGMNGLWYDHAANGHYLTIQRVHDDDTAVVIWNTFDRNGNQAWIYGVGHVTGRHIHVDMSQNLGGRLQPGGAPAGSSVSSWGTVDIDLATCLSGTLRYASPNPTYGSGQFPLDRLAYVSDFGCTE
ncbi:MAG TPA: choice-of-anchor Q domain-containing protein [Rhodanobacteraceae bacterium]|nr:choice-of-anchor Q domain-containing protein [Rhodanobacteraceae bacterium]